ncbi:sulfatase [Flavilitoribacter nigricans]|uniref:Iduronate-2-sulfatase n=1 Tax=Flavilitoribacter nigricans (strain ATCC 23147 / DSM 23189 / NBRC 102662 / NCIMB 1420 / SS-2) TaxID=1122177 RepID=A0A2D0NBY2_FLAN2|nr:sulfatase [Flavilitoribacter nigricans]PHN05997.1 iduronate-2-sulfatase [Flavilitoribacter nigricans DSM 23189 = NBRC 102662]
MISFRSACSILFVALLPACNTARKAAHSSRPNILFVIADDLSAEALSTYGNQQCRTPNIDRLASRGFRFTRAYCQYPVCGPSRAALMSGMYPTKMGIMNNGGSDKIDEILQDKASMPQLFKENGYHTTRLSKIYHMRVPGDITAGVNGPDHAPSWSERFNFQGAEWMTEGERTHLSNEKLQFKPDVHYNLGFGTAFYVVKGEGKGAEQPDYRATSKAIDIMQQHRKQSDQPFFLAVGYIRPHVPLVAPASAYEPFPPQEMELPEKVDNDQRDVPQLGKPRTSESFGISAPEKQREVLSAYYASVAFMDQQFGRLLDALEAEGLAENTIVVFTSDHGYHLGEHDFWQKWSLHEESVRIPLIIAGPGVEFSESDALAEQIDLYPTLAGLVGLSAPDHVQGKSLLPVLREPKTQVREAVYSVTSNGALLRTNDWAYMQYKDGSEELYDMNRDPQQYSNLAKIPNYQSKREEMARLLKEKQAMVVGNP